MVEVAEKWRALGRAEMAADGDPRHEAVHRELRLKVPAALEHTGAAAFDSHLLGVQAVLRGWKQDAALADAGLFHSIYGTEGFAGFALPFAERGNIRALVGARAERLAWIFCVMDRGSFDATVLGLYDADTTELGTHTGGALAAALRALDAQQPPISPTGEWPPSPPPVSQPGDRWRVHGLRARPELGGWPIALASEDEWLDLCTLSLADYCEQVEGAATKPNVGYGWAVGEAWGYRRVAYAGMAAVLIAERGLHQAMEMWREVYGAEPVRCRKHLTARTPALTPAARLAREAIASAAL